MALEQFSPMKILYHLDRVNDWLKGKNVYPITVEIDPSNFCNHDCIWCTFGYLHTKNKDVIPREVLLKLVKDLAEYGVKAIIWTGGGEPWTNNNLTDAIYLAYELGIDMGMATNGILLDKKKIEAIVRTHVYCRFSLDAGTPETYMKVHNAKEGDFEKAIENLKTMTKLKKELKNNISIGVAFLIHPGNYKEVYKSAKLVKEAGADFFQIKPVVMYSGKQLSPEFFANAEKEFGDVKKLEDKNFKVFVISYKFEDIANESNNCGRSYKKCWANPFMCSIGADCKVYLCCHLRGVPQFSFGNLKEKSFKEIWEGKQRQEAIKRINFALCQPLCKGHETNKILDFIKRPHPHKNIL
jgi:MoaA/NifB/PqqE/SkfB family radical SAM enzyme